MMGDKTKISWVGPGGHTFNVWWGCEHAPANPDDPDDVRTSPGCDNCYAQRFDKRIGGNHWGAVQPRRFFNEEYWAKPIRWNRDAQAKGVRAGVFCASMADWAEIHRDPEIRARQDLERGKLWRLIRQTPWLDWILVTKRPQNFAALLPWVNLNVMLPEPLCRDCADLGPVCPINQMPCNPHEAWPNVWLLVTGENTEQLVRRAAILRRTTVAVRGISAEPLLEHISAQTWDAVLPRVFHCPECEGEVGVDEDACCRTCGADCAVDWEIDWLIVGDESGARSGPNAARPAHPDWVRTARDAAKRHGVAFHFKQWAGEDADGISGDRSGPRAPIHLPILDGTSHPGRPR